MQAVHNLSKHNMYLGTQTVLVQGSGTATMLSPSGNENRRSADM